MRRACPSCGSLETVIINNRRNKFLVPLDWLIYLFASTVTAVITLGGFFGPPDVDMLPVARKCRGCGEVFAKGKARGKDTRNCRRCDYNLAGNVSGTCPECGTAIGDATKTTDATRSTNGA